jgi:hypothetical protein
MFVAFGDDTSTHKAVTIATSNEHEHFERTRHNCERVDKTNQKKVSFGALKQLAVV